MPLLLLLAACATAPAAGIAPQEAARAPDHSLSSADYAQSGMPVADRPWTPAEYDAAVRALTPVAARDPGQLPRFASARSGAVFDRFCSLDNLAALQDPALPPVQRLAVGSDYLRGTLGLLRLYYQATVATHGYATELVSLLGLTLRLSTLLAEVGNQVAAPDEASLALYQQGKVQMTAGFGNVAEGCLQSVAERELYGEPDRLRLAQFLQADLPRLFPFLPPQSRKLLPARIKRMAGEEPSGAVRGALEALHAALAPAAP